MELLCRLCIDQSPMRRCTDRAHRRRCSRPSHCSLPRRCEASSSEGPRHRTLSRSANIASRTSLGCSCKWQDTTWGQASRLRTLLESAHSQPDFCTHEASQMLPVHTVSGKSLQTMCLDKHWLHMPHRKASARNILMLRERPQSFYFCTRMSLWTLAVRTVQGKRQQTIHLHIPIGTPCLQASLRLLQSLCTGECHRTNHLPSYCLHHLHTWHQSFHNLSTSFCRNHSSTSTKSNRHSSDKSNSADNSQQLALTI